MPFRFRTQNRCEEEQEELHVNLHPFANSPFSNSWSYFIRNFDFATAGRTRFYKGTFDALLEEKMANMGLVEEYKIYEKEFKELFTLYMQAAEESGNYGRLVAIAIPHTLVPILCFPSTMGKIGTVTPYTIDGKPTTNLNEIAEGFDQLPFANQYRIIFTKLMLNATEAKKAGIRMRAFDTFSNPKTAAYLEYEAHFDTVMRPVKESYRERIRKN